MFSPRSNFSAVILDGMIVVIGGFLVSAAIARVEYYDVNSTEWHQATSMNLNGWELSACVSTGLPNAEEYSYASRIQGASTPPPPPPGPTPWGGFKNFYI
jgi:kelch-like protein 10